MKMNNNERSFIRWIKELFLKQDRKQLIDDDRKEYRGYFTMDCEFGFGKVMVLTGPWKPKFHKKMMKKGINALRLSDSAGWLEDDISFVSQLQELRSIEIYNWDVRDVSPIQNLNNLEHISLQCDFRKGLDFSVFKKLSNCFLGWRPKCDSLFQCKTLGELNLDKYPYSDLTPLKGLENLQILKLASRKIESLKGIEALSQLRFLDLFECTQLRDLEGIDQLTDLETFEINVCKKVTNIEGLKKLKKLRRFIFSNCGEVESLLPIRECKKLEELFFIESTNVLDGDVSFITELPNLKRTGFRNRKHYTHKCEDFEQCGRMPSDEIENR